MLNVSSPINRDQFRLLREAKSIIKNEFDEIVNLQDESILLHIYNFALESVDEKLFEIHEKLLSLASTDINSKQSSPASQAPSNTINNDVKSDKKIKVGDVVNGQKCISIYRGRPVFETA